MKVKQLILVLLVLAVGYAMMKYFLSTRNDPPKRPARPHVPVVEVQEVQTSTYHVMLETRGTVKARTEGTLVPQVSGRIAKVSPTFRDGGFFEKDDMLVQIEREDYEAAYLVAQNDVDQAQSILDQEKARVAQALENWEALDLPGDPGELVRRKPQLTEAQSKLDSAKGQLEKANRDRNRTTIRAPYAGRILKQMVDQGQVVNMTTVLASIYAVDYAEIRLPLSSAQMGYLELEESFRGDAPVTERDESEFPLVTFTSSLAADGSVWEGRVVRTEGAVDAERRQIFVVAQVKDPYGHKGDKRTPLKVGLPVEAVIQGRKLPDVFVIPRGAIREGDQVFLVTKEKKLERRRVTVEWTDEESVVVSAGLEPGERICLTNLSVAGAGSAVKVKGEDDGPGRGKPMSAGGREGKKPKPGPRDKATGKVGEPARRTGSS